MFASYLDHAATSPMPAEVLEEYTRALKVVGNPASTHNPGQLASAKLEQARRDVASALGCETVEVIFTSGGTESINLAIKGAFLANRKKDARRNIILMPRAEHHASLEAAEWLEGVLGAVIRYLKVDKNGVLTPEILGETLLEINPDEVAILSFLWANNEVGSIASVREIANLARANGITVHADAVAALGQIEIDFADSGLDMLSVSAHKIGGPVGVGALLIGRTFAPEALFHGGSQQRSRAGTQDVAGAVAFAKALELQSRNAAGRLHMRNLRDYLIEEVLARVEGAVLRGNADLEHRIPGNAHFTFQGCQGDSLLFLLDAKGVAVSVGSACQAGVQEISHVLLAMGLPEDEAIGSLRMTLSQETTKDEVDTFLRNLPEAVQAARRAGITSIEV